MPEERDDGRKANGHFAKGNPGGPGRPKQKRERKYLDATIACVSITNWKKIVKKAVEDAITGDAVARRWLGDYLLGRPENKIDIKSDGERISAGVAGLGGFVALVDELREGQSAQGGDEGDVGDAPDTVDALAGSPVAGGC